VVRGVRYGEAQPAELLGRANEAPYRGQVRVDLSLGYVGRDGPAASKLVQGPDLAVEARALGDEGRGRIRLVPLKQGGWNHLYGSAL
jgi:hypothetical protein